MAGLPELMQGSAYTKKVSEFKGYNHNLAIGDGEWYDEKGLSSNEYPLFSVRKKKYATGYTLYAPTIGGMFHRDGLGYVDGKHVYWKRKHVQGIELDPTLTPKHIVSMGAYVCIFPDAAYFNTTDLTDCGYMGEKMEYSGQVVISICKLDGSEFDDVTVSALAPEDPTEGQYWLDTSSVPHCLKIWSTSNGYWTDVPTCYVRIEIPEVGSHFRQYDAISISGISGSDQLSALNSESAYLYGIEDDAIIIAGILDAKTTATMEITLERKVPILDHVCEVNNRLWGCRYGETNGKYLNEIYCCKLGDFKNWYCYTGLSTDSYAVSVGTEGKFTGCCRYGGSAVFFKENSIHKIYGSAPSSFQLSTINGRGVQDGCCHSLKAVGEYLYYKSRTDVCVFDGSSQPSGISDALGGAHFDNAVAGTMGRKYLLSMRNTDTGVYTLYEYDTKRGIWHVLSDERFMSFASVEGDTWGIKSNGIIYSFTGKDGYPEEDIEWYAESGIIDYTNTYSEYCGRFEFRMKMPIGSYVKLLIDYDDEGIWRDQGTIHQTGTKIVMFPVRPMRCEHFRIKLVGKGDVKIYALTFTMEGGSSDTWRT